MIGNFKAVLRLIMPPILWVFFRRLAHFHLMKSPEWEYVPEGWMAAQRDTSIKGWDETSILEANKSRWDDFIDSISGTKPFGISPEATKSSPTNHLPFHNVIMTFAYVLSLAAENKKDISLLDWGGGIGHYYVLSQKLRPDLNINYHCKDFEQITNHGQLLFPKAHFYHDDQWKAQKYDLVFASGSLHYSENWKQEFESLVLVTKEYFYVTRLPIVQHVPSYVMIQRPYQYGYDTEYLGWCLNHDEVLETAEKCGLSLVREFVIEVPPIIKNAPEQPVYWGFLFRK